MYGRYKLYYYSVAFKLVFKVFNLDENVRTYEQHKMKGSGILVYLTSVMRYGTGVSCPLCISYAIIQIITITISCPLCIIVMFYAMS